MCGICGMFGSPDRDAVARMAASMVHRGPDDEGFYSDDRLALGFRRLSIIDVQGGHQPLCNEDGSIQVVFNGEIYNHLDLRKWLEGRGHNLRTGSDGEVLSHLYEESGDEFIGRLNGIFAFAIWDRPRNRLLLARDPHGVKPLYYAKTNRSFLFSSELRGLLASGLIRKELDVEAVGQYLIYQAVPPPKTILADATMLPPGSYLIHDATAARVRSYWRPPVQNKKTVTSVQEASERVRSGLVASVRRQLMSEVPLGMFLSGGVDSSAIVALAAPYVSGRMKTFSVGFVGPDEEVLTEWPWAKLVSERFGTDHHEVVLTEDIFCEKLTHVFFSMDQPTSDGINSYYVSLAAAEDVTVALSGTGGDELFLGYGRDAQLLDQYAKASRFEPLPRSYVARIARLLDRVPADLLWRSAEEMVGPLRGYARLDEALVSPRGIAIFEPHERDQVLSMQFKNQNGRFRVSTEYLDDDVPADPGRPGDWLSRIEQRAYMSFVLLRDIDAMSMTHSLEVRVPFLDLEYAKELASIPWEWKYRDGIGKWILKRSLRGILPDAVIDRPKMGFGLPYNVWMRRSLAPLVRETLSVERTKRRGVFDPIHTQRLVDQFYQGDDAVWRRVWTLFTLESWARLMLDGQNAL